MDNVLAQHLEDRHRPLDRGGFPTNHDGKRRLNGSDLTAADGRIQHIQASTLSLLGETARNYRGDAGHVDQQRSLFGAGKHSLVAGKDLIHLRGVGEHRDHNLRLCGELLRITGGSSALLRQLFYSWPASVMDNKRIARLHEVARHGLPHDAQTNKADDRFGHRIVPFENLTFYPTSGRQTQQPRNKSRADGPGGRRDSILLDEKFERLVGILNQGAPVKAKKDRQGAENSEEGGSVRGHRDVLIRGFRKVEKHRFYDAGIIVEGNDAVDDPHHRQKIKSLLDHSGEEKKFAYEPCQWGKTCKRKEKDRHTDSRDSSSAPSQAAVGSDLFFTRFIGDHHDY